MKFTDANQDINIKINKPDLCLIIMCLTKFSYRKRQIKSTLTHNNPTLHYNPHNFNCESQLHMFYTHI